MLEMVSRHRPPARIDDDRVGPCRQFAAFSRGGWSLDDRSKESRSRSSVGSRHGRYHAHLRDCRAVPGVHGEERWCRAVGEGLSWKCGCPLDECRSWSWRAPLGAPRSAGQLGHTPLGRGDRRATEPLTARRVQPERSGRSVRSLHSPWYSTQHINDFGGRGRLCIQCHCAGGCHGEHRLHWRRRERFTRRDGTLGSSREHDSHQSGLPDDWQYQHHLPWRYRQLHRYPFFVVIGRKSRTGMPGPCLSPPPERKVELTPRSCGSPPPCPGCGGRPRGTDPTSAG
jgi:hypothetical protein